MRGVWLCMHNAQSYACHFQLRLLQVELGGWIINDAFNWQVDSPDNNTKSPEKVKEATEKITDDDIHLSATEQRHNSWKKTGWCSDLEIILILLGT